MREIKIKLIVDMDTKFTKMETQAKKRITEFSKSLEHPFKRIVLKQMLSNEILDDNKVLATFAFDVED